MDDDNYVREKLNQTLFKRMQEIQLKRLKACMEQEKKAKKEKMKNEIMQGTGKSRSGKMDENNAQSKIHILLDQQRELHEAFQILLIELQRKKLLRRKQARIQAQKEKRKAAELAAARAKCVLPKHQDSKSMSKVAILTKYYYYFNTFHTITFVNAT